ncbi:MAG: carbamoyl-phosphate synthase large subunit [Phycisphaeraceae bacterium]
MPKRTDIKTILIIGSGPIVIGQGCEFDYSGTQACKALREEGYQVVLINSNPATIMTDPEFADRTYIEPITPEAVEKIIAKENAGKYHIDALLPTLGGQTALNCACKLYDSGVLTKFGVEMIGATRQVIYRAEDRKAFKEICESIGLKLPAAGIATTMDEAWQVVERTGLPAIIRPAFTLGGTGGGIAYNREEFEEIVRRGLDASMTSQVQIDQSVIGWKEFELEVMRDRDDNVVIICSIENVDPMGVHTGDSITVAPAQTLTDKEYQRMRDAAQAIIRAIGVETGGCNIQFAIDPDNGEMVVVEMNPRVSRSSALASKATGFAIAKIAAKLAVGYTLWELPNDITGKTVACFEPTIDYVVTKIPRWTFEKFPEADETLTTQMKSVGEAMSIGRTFKESLQKGIRSMEVKRFGLGLDANDKWLNALRATIDLLKREHPQALAAIRKAGSLNAGGADGRLCSEIQAAALLYEDAALHPQLSAKARQQLDIIIQGLGAGHGSVVRTAANPDRAAAQAVDRGVRHYAGHVEQLLDADWPISAEKLTRKLSVPSQGRLYYIRYAFKMGWSIDKIYDLTRIDRWFLDQFKQLVDFEQVLISYERLEDLPRAVLFEAKQLGYSDAQLANLYLGKISAPTILDVREHRKSLDIVPVYKLVDTCAAEFEATTPYYYSTYEAPIISTAGAKPQAAADDEIRVSNKKKIIILGGGPNRIGQGIEFDYCCVQAAFAADELGFESVMINSNPETVSTDYDTSDLLFFEPLTLEDVLNIYDRLNGETDSGLVHGMIVQFGGQTPLNLAHGLETAGVPIIGTSVESIDLASNRERFTDLLRRLNIRQPGGGIAMNVEQAIQVANKIGYPVLVRPSFVLGGRAMETVFDDQQLRHYTAIALGASDLADQPILIDKFLSEAIECDVDVIADYAEVRSAKDQVRSSQEVRSTKDQVRSSEAGASGTSDFALRTSNLATSHFALGTSNLALICGVMEHIEEAGIHSGDSACAIPPFSLPAPVIEQLKVQSRKLAEALQVRGLMNIQYAIKRPDSRTGANHEIYVLEVNPRASRTVPFVSKATGVPWARIAAKVMAGKSLAQLSTREVTPRHTSVKESVFPFSKFPGVDIILGPEMRSTGEVMGIDSSFPMAFAKSQIAAGNMLPTRGQVFLSVRDSDKPHVLDIARKLLSYGFTVLTTGGTHEYLKSRGVETQRVRKISEGRPHALDMIKNHELALIINTPNRKGLNTDEGKLRAMAVRFNVPIVTTTTGAAAVVLSMAALAKEDWDVRALQDYF